MTRSKDQLLHDLDPTRPDTIQALIDFHRRSFGGYRMEDETGKGDGGDDDAGKSGDEKTDDSEALGEGGKKALKAERDARQALERQLAELKASQIDPKKLAEALGLKPDDAKSTGDDLVATLQKQVSDMQHQTLLYRVAAKHQITDGDDLELLRSLSDESAMDKLASRLATASSRDGKDDDDEDGKQKRRGPRADKSQGQGSAAGNGRASSVTQVMEERRAAREGKN